MSKSHLKLIIYIFLFIFISGCCTISNRKLIFECYQSGGVSGGGRHLIKVYESSSIAINNVIKKEDYNIYHVDRATAIKIHELIKKQQVTTWKSEPKDIFDLYFWTIKYKTDDGFQEIILYETPDVDGSQNKIKLEKLLNNIKNIINN